MIWDGPTTGTVSHLLFKPGRQGLEHGTPAIGFTLTFDQDTNNRFVRDGQWKTSKSDGYWFEPDLSAQGVSVDGGGDEHWEFESGTVTNYFDNYDLKYKTRAGFPPTRKYNVGAFYVLEYNGDAGRFEPVANQNILV